MPLYYFDLKDGIPVRDREGHQCTDDKDAIFQGAFIAQRIGTEWPEYSGRGHYISVVNEEGHEIHRALILSTGSASRCHHGTIE